MERKGRGENVMYIGGVQKDVEQEEAVAEMRWLRCDVWRRTGEASPVVGHAAHHATVGRLHASHMLLPRNLTLACCCCCCSASPAGSHHSLTHTTYPTTPSTDMLRPATNNKNTTGSDISISKHRSRTYRGGRSKVNHTAPQTTTEPVRASRLNHPSRSLCRR